MSKTLNIGIAGAGVGGLAAAAMLARAGHAVTVFDQFEAPAPVGSGLLIQPVGQAVLNDLGLLDKALSLGAYIKNMEGTEARSQRRVLDVTYDPAGQRFGLALHRATLHHLLLEAARQEGAKLVPKALVSGSRIVANRRELFTQAGASDHDLVIDASGADSPLSPLRATPLPFGALWGVAPLHPETDASVLAQAYRRANKMAGVLPIGRLPGSDETLAAVFWSLSSEGYGAWLARGFEAWQSEARALWPAFGHYADALAGPKAMTFARYSHGTLRRPYEDRLAFIGDAAHRTSPQLGQGANMALLDAAALSLALEVHGVEAALPAYAAARRWHVYGYQTISRVFTPMYQSNSRVIPLLRDWMLTPITKLPLADRVLSRLVAGDLIKP
ncbi:MAG: FAD-dependent monooxygenase [Pseudomonadota bacterium]